MPKGRSSKISSFELWLSEFFRIDNSDDFMSIVLVKPRKSLEQRILAHKFSGKMMLNRMANEYSLSQPSFAAELRNMAARD